MVQAMGFHIAVSTFIVLIVLCAAVTSQATFTITPTSVNATLGSTANFTCSVSDGVSAWIVDGTLLSRQNRNLMVSTTDGTSTLHIPATEEYSNTNVTCALAILGGEDLYSDPVFLKVQGPPAAVSNLESKNFTSVICLTWDAPFTLDITGVDPDIWYCVNINVTTVAEHPDVTSLTTNCSVYTPEFNFTMDYPNTSTRVIYEFRVTPRNGAGDGPTSGPVYGFFSGPPASITEEMVEVSVSVNPLDVNLSISYVGGIPPGEMPTHLQVYASTTDDDQNKTSFSDIIPFKLSSDGMVFIRLNESTGGSICRRYKTIISAKNDLGTTNSTGKILFSTHEVQTVRANNCSRPGVVNISCTFAENSRAMGYLSILHSESNASQEMFIVANRSGAFSADLNISVPGIPPGDYMVSVFDLESSGLPVLSTATNPYVRSAGESDNITVLEPGEDEDDNIVSVNGTFLEVPDPAMSTELQLCISFESSTSSDRIVVLAHHTDSPSRLSAYDNQCFRAPTAGSYYFAVFTQNSDNTLEAPATPPEFLMRTVSISSPVPSPSVTPPTTVTDPVPSSLGAIVAVIVIAVILVGIVEIVRPVIVIATVMMKKRNYKRFVLGEGCESNSSGLIYADVKALPAKTKPPALDNMVQYSAILPQPVITTPSVKPTPPPLPAKRHSSNKTLPRQQSSINMETLFSELYSVTPKWKELAEVIGIDEDRLDEIDTNNEREEECLRAVLEVWMKKSTTWPTVTDSLREIGEVQLAGSVYHKYTFTGGVEAAKQEAAESGVQESQQNNISYATFAYPQTCETRLVSDVQNDPTPYIKGEHSACACTLPGMVEPPPQRASPKPTAASTVVYLPDGVLDDTPSSIQSFPVVEMTSLEPPHCVQDRSLDESQATLDEKENVSAAQKDINPEEAHSDSGSSTYAEETVNKGGKHHGIHSVRIDSQDSGILIEDAKQEEGESGIPVSDGLVSRKPDLELLSPAEQLQSNSVCKDFQGCSEEFSSHDEVDVSQESIQDLAVQAITETHVTDKNSSALVVGCISPNTRCTTVPRITTTVIGCTWSTEPPIRQVLDIESNRSAVLTTQSNDSQLISVEHTSQDTGTCVGSESTDAMLEKNGEAIAGAGNSVLTQDISPGEVAAQNKPILLGCCPKSIVPYLPVRLLLLFAALYGQVLPDMEMVPVFYWIQFLVGN